MIVFPYYTGEYSKRIISRYAMIPDYHLVAGNYLEQIVQCLQKKFAQNTFCFFVDNSPLREVHCAYQAGLGVIGENGLLIHEQYGSYLFLGEIVTDLPLFYHSPQNRECLHCHLCRTHCPNHALTATGSVTLELCRSHITQKKGELSPFEQSEIQKGGFVWGCDICNDVCPMNRTAKMTPIPEFLSQVTPHLDVDSALELLKTRPYNYRGAKTILRNFDLIHKKEDTVV